VPALRAISSVRALHVIRHYYISVITSVRALRVITTVCALHVTTSVRALRVITSGFSAYSLVVVPVNCLLAHQE